VLEKRGKRSKEIMILLFSYFPLSSVILTEARGRHGLLVSEVYIL
jgi:hypothetical protein